MVAWDAESSRASTLAIKNSALGSRVQQLEQQNAALLASHSGAAPQAWSPSHVPARYTICTRPFRQPASQPASRPASQPASHPRGSTVAS